MGHHHHHHLPAEFELALRSWIRRHKQGLRIGCFACILLAIPLLMGLIWAAGRGVVYLKDYVVSNAATWVPVQWEQKLGDVAFAQIKAQSRFINDTSVLSPLNRLAAPLIESIPENPYQFVLFVSESKEINAFALPGGYLVLNRGLLEKAGKPEEIQGVIAHEIAHILKRHSLLQMAQNIGLEVAVRTLWDNENPLLDYLIKNGSKLLSLKFTRDHERAADDLAWELLQMAQINPQGLVDFFSGLKLELDARGTGNSGPEAVFLSTHPTPQDRIDRLRQKKSIPGIEGFKTFDAEFKDLQDGLRMIP
jgi:predicted Zn-dependent protease